MAGFYYLLNNTGIEYITIEWESICRYYKKKYRGQGGHLENNFKNIILF